MSSSIDLPSDRPQASPNPSRSPQHAKSSLGLPAPCLNRSAILVVEDNLVNQTITVNQLANLGYQADVAENGQAALDALGTIADWNDWNPPYQLILMDCNMPVMDGYRATQEIRKLEAKAQERCAQMIRDGQSSDPPQTLSTMAIVALTANVMATDRVRAFSVGMDDYLTKPVSVDTLKRTVERWLAVSQQDTFKDTSQVTVTLNPGAEYSPPSHRKPYVHLSSLSEKVISSPVGPVHTIAQAPPQSQYCSPLQPYEPPLKHDTSTSTDIPSISHPSAAPCEAEHPTLSHLDWTHLHALSDSDHYFEMTLLELFIEDCQEQLRQLQQAIAQSDIAQIEKISHYIKGASANVGAQYMQHYAHQIEQQVRHTQLTCFDGEVSRLQTSLSIIQEMFAAQQEAR